MSIIREYYDHINLTIHATFVVLSYPRDEVIVPPNDSIDIYLRASQAGCLYRRHDVPMLEGYVMDGTIELSLLCKEHDKESKPTRNNPHSRVRTNKHQRQELESLPKHSLMQQRAVSDQGYRNGNIQQRKSIEEKDSRFLGATPQVSIVSSEFKNYHLRRCQSIKSNHERHEPEYSVHNLDWRLHCCEQ